MQVNMDQERQKDITIVVLSLLLVVFEFGQTLKMIIFEETTDQRLIVSDLVLQDIIFQHIQNGKDYLSHMHASRGTWRITGNREYDRVV